MWGFFFNKMEMVVLKTSYTLLIPYGSSVVQVVIVYSKLPMKLCGKSTEAPPLMMSPHANVRWCQTLTLLGICYNSEFFLDRCSINYHETKQQYYGCFKTPTRPINTRHSEKNIYI